MKRPTHLLLPLILSLWAVRAEAAKVVIVRPARPSPELKETLSRLEGEVLSLGLEVAIAERPAASGATAVDSRAWVERIATERDTDAVIEVVGDAGPTAIEIWVFERRPRRSEVSRVALDPSAENPPARLAIRAVEALRSSLVEVDLVAKGQRQATVAREPPATVTQSQRREAEESAKDPKNEPARHIDLQAGTALLTSLDGVGPALMPVVRVGWTAPSFVPSWLALQGALAGLGSRPNVTSAAGSARVAQQSAVLGLCTCVGSTRALQPYAALSAGVLRTAIDGQANTPEDAHFVERWSFLLEGAFGARVRLPGRYHLTLAAHVQMAEPYIAIHIVDTRVATTGRPNLLLSLTIGAWL